MFVTVSLQYTIYTIYNIYLCQSRLPKQIMPYLIQFMVNVTAA
jgi:hypothetical protein